MRLTDVMSDAGLVGYTEIAMLIFLAVFVGIVIYVFSKKKAKDWEAASYMPLDDHKPRTPREDRA